MSQSSSPSANPVIPVMNLPLFAIRRLFLLLMTSDHPLFAILWSFRLLFDRDGDETELDVSPDDVHEVPSAEFQDLQAQQENARASALMTWHMVFFHSEIASWN